MVLFEYRGKGGWTHADHGRLTKVLAVADTTEAIEPMATSDSNTSHPILQVTTTVAGKERINIDLCKTSIEVVAAVSSPFSLLSSLESMRIKVAWTYTKNYSTQS